MATSTTSVALSPLLVKLNVTGLQKRDQPLYDFLSHLLFTTGQIAAVAGVVSSGGGGGSTTITNNFFQQQFLNLTEGGVGDDGSPGPPGPQGNPGNTGATGASGVIGPATYLTDISAPDEVFPIPGPIGLTGNTGLTGNDGPAIFLTAQDGMDGEPSSIPGPQGPQGNTGATGNTGNAGPGIFVTDEHYVDDPIPIPGGQGPTGNPGSTGPSGAAGIIAAIMPHLDDYEHVDDPPIGFAQPQVSTFWNDVIATVNQDIVSSTTLTNDNALSFAVAANKLYEFEAHIAYVSVAGGGTPDFKFVFTAPAANTGSFIALYYVSTADAFNGPTVQNAIATSNSIGTATTPRVTRVEGWTFSTTAGTLNFQWAQSVSSTLATTRLAGSTLRWHQYP